MAFRSFIIYKNIRRSGLSIVRNNTLIPISKDNKIQREIKEYRTESNIKYLEDPDCFGTLAGQTLVSDVLVDEGDIKEEQFLQNIPPKSQKLTIKQYADLIKQYLKHKRLKEAIDVLEIRMLIEDRVKPENYIYNILIGACAGVGYTKKAFKLYNDMKRRALKPTGDTYTCLFEACINSPWSTDGLKMATHLRNHMLEKGIEPNLTNYNVMIKAFGRCSDIPTAFKIVDEMISKKIKIRVHTLNHLLQACISDKEHGLKHALIVWRKMLKMREKPNIYSFNLLLKCVKECNLGNKEDLLDIISLIQEQMSLLTTKQKILEIEASKTCDLVNNQSVNDKIVKDNGTNNFPNNEDVYKDTNQEIVDTNTLYKVVGQCNTNLELFNKDSTSFQLIENYKSITPHVPERTTPNLISKIVQINQILGVQEVHTPQDKFAIIGGQEDFLTEMGVYSVKPDIKIFTQMLPLIEDNLEAENKLLDRIKTLNIKSDINFYNTLIKRRCFRKDYDNAIGVMEIIDAENKHWKKHPFNKKLIKANIMTYGALALGCTTKERAQNLIKKMEDKQLKVNIEILGTLLRNATCQMQFGYILYILDIVKKEKMRINYIFMKHLENFIDKCVNIIEKNDQEQRDCPILKAAYKRFSNIYHDWLKEINVEEMLEPEHPWKQFMEPQPIPIQRNSIKIVEPKKFYKRNRRFVSYKTKI